MTQEGEEFATINQLMTALYSSISGPPGGQDFELSRRLYHPDGSPFRTVLELAEAAEHPVLAALLVMPFDAHGLEQLHRDQHAADVAALVLVEAQEGDETAAVRLYECPRDPLRARPERPDGAVQR